MEITDIQRSCGLVGYLRKDGKRGETGTDGFHRSYHRLGGKQLRRQGSGIFEHSQRERFISSL